MGTNKSNENKYIQQHLANERTYLAWVRTAIAVVGIGFLITNLHYSISIAINENPTFEIIIWIGGASIIIGVATIMYAMISYMIKKRQINNETFTSPYYMIVIASITMIIVILAFGLIFMLMF